MRRLGITKQLFLCTYVLAIALLFWLYITITPDERVYREISSKSLIVVGTSAGVPEPHISLTAPSASNKAEAAVTPSALHSIAPSTESENKATGHPERILDFVQSHMVKSQGIRLQWIAERMERMADSWEKVRNELQRKSPELFENSQNILIVPGLVTDYSSYSFAEEAYKGGYLGELVQWSDLLSILCVLGHKITVATDKKMLQSAASPDRIDYDLIFTDYLGLAMIHDAALFGAYKCRFRVLDSFGTDAMYNFHTRNFLFNKDSEYFAQWNFEHLRQFWTLFPHSPDNSFLGFAVYHPNYTDMPTKRKNQSVIYGKEAPYLNGHNKFLSTIGQQFEIHGTYNGKSSHITVPIVNHGVLSQPKLLKLLQESKLFIGLGFPYDGPGPMEALANGCVFIQPKFDSPHNNQNTQFFSGKPFRRGYSSPMPYLQDFVGEPYVYTVHENAPDEVTDAVKKALSSPDFISFIPHEFTQLGMLERVGEFVLHQKFCDGDNLALGKTASSKDNSPSAGGAIDGVPTIDTCYRSKSRGPHWWMVDLGGETAIGKIRFTVTFDWFYAANIQRVTISPFLVTLLNSDQEVILSKRFTDDRIFYLWERINTRARFVHVETFPGNIELLLCVVEVYSESEIPIWPDLSYLRPTASLVGESCKDACMRHKMVCEPAYFQYLNTERALREHLNCTKSFHIVETSYVDYLPAMAVSKIQKEDCFLNGNSMLLSCTGNNGDYKRLCPCRQYADRQIGLPPH